MRYVGTDWSAEMVPIRRYYHRAPRICLSEEEVIRIMRNEDAIKKKIGNLIDSMLCDDSQISEMDNTKNKTEAFDIDEFV